MIRTEAVADGAAVHRLHLDAFETDAEARLVDLLRANGRLVLSLVAELRGEVVGHVAFSPVTLSSDDGSLVGVGLGPVAVSPSHQGIGIGSALIEAGLERLRGEHPFCVVLGHAGYYPRFGFVRASGLGIRWEHPVDAEHFFVQELAPGGLAGVSGIVRYAPEFDGV